MKTFLYGGSFDLWTVGHQFIADEALALCDKLYIAVATNSNKKATFSTQEKVEMIKNAFPLNPKVEVVSFENQFLVNFCKQHHVDAQVRGLRNVADLDYEKSVLYINNKINPQLKTVYFVAPTEVANISSSLVKSLVGLPEWQFIVQDLIPKSNMSIIMAEHYGKPLLDMLKSGQLGLSIDYPLVSKLYSAPGRYYHTLQHVIEMLASLQNHANLAILDWRRRALFAAAIYHDIVYNPLAKDNEEKSVELFKELSKDGDYSSEEIRFISALVMATKNHESDDPLHNLFNDADLSILAAKPDRFNEYERQIRAEYSFAPDALYNKGRGEFVQEMLSRPVIFTTKEYSEYETAARTNLTNLLNKIQ